MKRLQSGKFRVTAMEETPYTSKPSPPFTTSTLQQEANRKLGFTARRTMTVAQSLYRKRPHHLHAYRLDDARRSRGRARARTGAHRIRSRISCPTKPRMYQSKVKNAQEAHEAIRPAGHPFELPAVLQVEARAGRVPTVRIDLETDHRQPNGKRPRTAASASTLESDGVRVSRRAVKHDRLRRLPAGLCRRKRRPRCRTRRQGKSAAAARRGRSSRPARSSKRRATPRSRRRGSAKRR